MASPSSAKMETMNEHQGLQIKRYFPFMDWLFHYQRENLVGDVMAGVIVAIMLVPQGMAYALLAGLPPEVGLYASIVPLIIYGLMGTSRALAVGPTAVVSLLVLSGISQFSPQNVSEYVSLAITLAFMIGGIQVIMGLLRGGFMVNFLSHPVLSGFTSAAAIVIGFSQLKHVMGISFPRTEYLIEQVMYAVEHVGETNPITLALALVSIGILLFFKQVLPGILKKHGLPGRWITPITKAGPFLIVVIGILLVGGLSLDMEAGVSIVGEVPSGLPPITIPIMDFETIKMLLPTAITISLISFMESISVAKSLASKRREKLDANQELVAIGAANIGAAFTGGYPVTGGFSRSVVNFTAGANTGLASLITAGLMALTVTFLMPLFYYLPNAVLAAIILVAVATLFDLKTFKQAWLYSKIDALSLAATFIAVLALGIEVGIIVGVATALALYLWRTSTPHIAVVGRVGTSEHFRNTLRHDVTTCPHVMAVRIDESLYFANSQFLESFILNAVAENPKIDHLVLVGSAINFIDTSALEVLKHLIEELHDAEVTLHLAEIKGPVMDRLKLVGFPQQLGKGRVFLSTHEAMQILNCVPDMDYRSLQGNLY